MKFFEHKAKEIFARYGIPVPRGIVASKPDEITDPPLPCMVKAQVLVGGRGKAGGIRPAETLEEARQVAGQILGMDIHGYQVKQVYLEERLSIAKELYLGYSVPGAGEPLFQAASANLNPWSEAKVNSTNPDRGPMLIVSADSDHTVPWAIANASYKKQKRNKGVTEIVKMPGRGHSLTIDAGWREVAEKALEFVKRFTTITAKAA